LFIISVAIVQALNVIVSQRSTGCSLQSSIWNLRGQVREKAQNSSIWSLTEWTRTSSCA